MLKQTFRLAFALLSVLSLSRLPAFAQNYVFQSTIAEKQLSFPVALAADRAGNLWIAGDNRVTKYDVNRNISLTLGAGFNGAPGAIGGIGTGNGQFNTPKALAVDRNGNLFVADYGNARIQEFDTNGNYLRTLTNGPAFAPVNLAVDSAGTLYALDASNYSAAKFSTTGAFAGYFANPNSNARYIAIDAQDNVYVFAGVGSAYFYNTAGQKLRNVPLPANIPLPTGVALDASGDIYTMFLNTVPGFVPSGGIYEISPSGSLLMSQLKSYPVAIATDGNGAIYAVYPAQDSGPLKTIVNRVDSSAAPGNGATLTDTSPSAVNGPRSPVVDAQGNVYFLTGGWAASQGITHISKFDRAGNFLGYFADGQVQAPSKLLLDGAGHIVVYDNGNAKTFDFGGSLLSAAPAPPTGVVFDRTGNYYTSNIVVTTLYYHGTETFTLYINKYGPSGQLLKQYPGYTLGQVVWNGGYELAAYYATLAGVDSQGNIFVNATTTGYRDIILKLSGNNGVALTTITDCFATLLDSKDRLYTYHETGGTFTDSSGYYYSSYDSVRILDDNGNLLSQFGMTGILPGQLNLDGDMFLDGKGNLYIANSQYNRIDIFAPGTNVVGTVALEGVGLQAGTAIPLPNITVQFRAPGTTAPLFTRTVTLTPDSPVVGKGAFTIADVPPGTYDLAFKAPNSLQTTIPNVPVSGMGYGPDVFLRGGDANNDNSVDSSDFGILIGAYNSALAIPGSGYDASADFNYDGSVDSSDFFILIGNFGSSGQ